METSGLELRLPRDVKACLAYRANRSNRNMNAEAIYILKNALRVDPVVFTIWRCCFGDETLHYTASLGDNIDHFYQGPSAGTAYETVLAEIRKLGLKLRDVVIQPRAEVFVAAPTANCEDEAA